MALICEIGGVDYGPAGEQALQTLRLSPATHGEIGSATLLLNSASAEIVDKQQVFIYESDDAGHVTQRLFAGFVSRVKTTIIKGTGERVWLAQCQDWNLLLDRLVGLVDTSHTINVPAGLFSDQINFVATALQSGSALGIDATSGVANLTSLLVLPAQVFRGMSLRDMIQAICDQARRADGTLQPRFYIGYDSAAGAIFGSPVLQVFDFAVAGAVANWRFSDNPGAGEFPILGTFSRDLDGSNLINYQQTVLQNNGLVSTGVVDASRSQHPNPYSGQNAWAAPPLNDSWSANSGEAQAYADSLVSDTAFPYESVSFATDQPVAPGQYVDVTMAAEGLSGQRYEVSAVDWDFAIPGLPLATLWLGQYQQAGVALGDAAIADVRALPVFQIRYFGALADGVSDDSAAISNALAAADWAGGGIVELGPGVIKCDAPITLGDNTHLRGDGPGATVVDFSNISGGAAADPCVTASGSLGSVIGALAADVALHDSQLVFSSDVGLAPGDTLLLYDGADYSFSGARKYYRNGEYVRVFSYDSASKTAQLCTRTHAAYKRNVHSRIVITGSPTGGTYTLTYNGQTTVALAYNASAATVQAALAALSSVGAGKVVCSSLGSQPDSPIDVVFDLTLSATSFSGAAALSGGTSPTLNTQAGKVAVYKPTLVTVSVQAATMKFKYGYRGIKTDFTHGARFRDLELSGSDYSHIETWHAFETDFINCIVSDQNAASGSYRYGVAIINSQRINVASCALETSRHGLTTGGADFAGAIPVRELMVTGCTISGNKSQEDDNGINGCNIHGNTEYAVFSGCNMPNGLDVCGDHITVIGCSIRNGAGNGVYMTETLGFNYSFIGNQVFITHDHPDNFGFVYGQFKAQYTARTGGTLRFADNYFEFEDHQNATPGQAMAGLYLYNVSGPSDNAIVIENNHFHSSLSSATAPIIGPWVRAYSGAGLREVIFRNNHCRGVGIRAEEVGSRLVVIEGNTVENALDRGIMLKKPSATPAYSGQVVVCRDNTVLNAKYNGIQLEGSAQADTIMYVTGNFAVNNNQSGASGTIALETSVYMHNAERVFFDNNVCGDNQSTPTQAAFWCADSVTNLYDVNTRNIGGVTTIGSTGVTNEYSGLATFTGSITDAQHGARSGGALHAAATTATNGFMSAADKTKIDQFSPTAGKLFAVAKTITLDAGADGYTLTVPASGSAALLAVAQTFTAQQTLDVTSGGLRVSAAATIARDIQFHTSLSPRWILRCTNTSESGGNAGSNFQLLSRTDAGAALATVIDINRASAAATFAGAIAASNFSGSHTGGGALVAASGKTLTASNSLTLAGTDGKALTLTGSLTVPADGTAALLATAQTFTAAQTINFTTADPASVYAITANMKPTFSATSTATLGAGLFYVELPASSNNLNTFYASRYQIQNLATGGTASNLTAMSFVAANHPSSSGNVTTFNAMDGSVLNSGNGVVTTANAINLIYGQNGSGAAASVGTANGLQLEVWSQNTAGAGITTANHINLKAPNGSGPITTLTALNIANMGRASIAGTTYGVNIANQSGGGTHYAIKTGSGIHAFGSSAATIGFFGATPAGQQTGGAATAAATYGATEQGMLNKVYSAMRTFGLLS